VRPAYVFLSAAGNTKWILHDTWQTPPAITLAGYVSNGATLTWAVQYTCDDLSLEPHQVLCSQSGTTTLTITDTGPQYWGTGNPGGHGLLTGDYVSLQNTGYGVDGEYTVTVTSATQYTVTTVASPTFTGYAQAIVARVFTHATLTGQSARATGNYAFPVTASRLQITAFTSGTAFLEVLQGGMST
jgi:hypothetical protein